MSQRRNVPGFGQVWEGGGELQGLRDWTFPWPIPYSAIGYFFVVLVGMFILRRVPILNLTVSWLSVVTAYTVVPAVTAIALSKLEPYGRPAYKHVCALLRHQLLPKTRCLGRPLRPVSTTAVLDGRTMIANEPDARPARVITGPATVDLCAPVALQPRRRHTWIARPATDGVRRVELGEGERLVVQP